MLWIVHRAVVQSITVDEATTYLYWVAPSSPAHWIPNSNNHVLNSMLMRLFVFLFGLSDLTVRMPALLGAAVYIFAVYSLCTLLARGLALTWALLVCFVFNPFLMDYLVAARGYGLALGFLSLAIYLVARMLVRPQLNLERPEEREILSHAAAISVCAAFSFAANFTFAYANAFLVLAFFAWACREQRKRGSITCVRLALACAVPGLVVALILTGSVLLEFPRDHLFWGAHSLSESWRELRRLPFSEFDEIDAFFVTPMFADVLRAVRPHLPEWGASVLILYVVLLLIAWRMRDGYAKSRLLLASSLTAVLILTVVAHWLQFKLLKIPLPFERTSLFFVPLLTALVGAVFSVSASNLPERLVRGIGVALLCVTGIYFLATLRDSHFNEWRPGADVKAAFPAVLDLCRRAGVREVAVDPNYSASLNFYRVLYHTRQADLCPPGGPLPGLHPDRRIAGRLSRPIHRSGSRRQAGPAPLSFSSQPLPDPALPGSAPGRAICGVGFPKDPQAGSPQPRLEPRNQIMILQNEPKFPSFPPRPIPKSNTASRSRFCNLLACHVVTLAPRVR